MGGLLRSLLQTSRRVWEICVKNSMVLGRRPNAMGFYYNDLAGCQNPGNKVGK